MVRKDEQSMEPLGLDASEIKRLHFQTDRGRKLTQWKEMVHILPLIINISSLEDSWKEFCITHFE